MSVVTCAAASDGASHTETGWESGKSVWSPGEELHEHRHPAGNQEVLTRARTHLHDVQFQCSVCEMFSVSSAAVDYHGLCFIHIKRDHTI